ncbi:MAG: PilZ domain-containing protein [Treponema sp.]|nr:PilZ domain-containing protein [Treponema sp.]
MTEFSIKRMRETLHQQHTGLEKGAEYRSHTRYRSFARVKFHGLAGKENLLKNMSVLGCCVECTSLADIQPDGQYVLEVMPEAASRIGHFELEVKVVWIRPSGYSGDVGFTITASPKGKLFQRYVDYLSWRDANQRQDPDDSPGPRT